MVGDPEVQSFLFARGLSEEHIRNFQGAVAVVNAEAQSAVAAAAAAAPAPAQGSQGGAPPAAQQPRASAVAMPAAEVPVPEAAHGMDVDSTLEEQWCDFVSRNFNGEPNGSEFAQAKVEWLAKRAKIAA